MGSSWFHNLAQPTIRYCEPNVQAWVAQPANAVSSLCITAAGIYILTNRRHPYAVYLGIVAVIQGLASFFYYASFTFIGQLADLGTMYLLASLLIVAALRRRKFSAGFNISMLIAGTAIPLAITVVIRTIGNFNIGIPLFAVLLAVAIYVEVRSARAIKFNLRYFGLAFIIFAIGYIFWWLDYKRIWCQPASSHYINGHALWHVCNAAALVSLHRYYSQIGRQKTDVPPVKT